MDHIIELPQPILDLYEAHKAMCKHFDHPRLKFTLDGRLLGDIGEMLVSDAFGVDLCEKRTGGVDGLAQFDGRTVQIKATQDRKNGPSFSYSPNGADHLIFVWIKFEGADRGAHVLYNGPEDRVRRHITKEVWSSTITVNRGKVVAEHAQLTDDQRLIRIR